jgi:hypothetical protein
MLSEDVNSKPTDHPWPTPRPTYVFIDDAVYSIDLEDAYHLASSRHCQPSRPLPEFPFGIPTVGSPIFERNLPDANNTAPEIVD